MAGKDGTLIYRRKTRLSDMNKAGIDVKVLTAGLVHHYTYWAIPIKA